MFPDKKRKRKQFLVSQFLVSASIPSYTLCVVAVRSRSQYNLQAGDIIHNIMYLFIEICGMGDFRERKCFIPGKEL